MKRESRIKMGGWLADLLDACPVTPGFIGGQDCCIQALPQSQTEPVTQGKTGTRVPHARSTLGISFGYLADLQPIGKQQTGRQRHIHTPRQEFLNHLEPVRRTRCQLKSLRRYD